MIWDFQLLGVEVLWSHECERWKEDLEVVFGRI